MLVIHNVSIPMLGQIQHPLSTNQLTASPSHGKLNLNLHTSNTDQLHANSCKHFLDQSTHLSCSFPCVTSMKFQKYVSSPRLHFRGFPLKSPQPPPSHNPVSVIFAWRPCLVIDGKTIYKFTPAHLCTLVKWGLST